MSAKVMKAQESFSNSHRLFNHKGAKHYGARASRPLLLFLVCLICAPLSAEKFLADDPVWLDQDNMTIAEPERIELSQVYDFLENSFGHVDKTKAHAANINTLGEVPDSSWFTNRIGKQDVTIDQIVQGPN